MRGIRISFKLKHILKPYSNQVWQLSKNNPSSFGYSKPVFIRIIRFAGITASYLIEKEE